MYKNVLVPIDVQHRSSWTMALPVAVHEAKASGGRLCVLTVVPDFYAGVDWRYAIRGEQHGSAEYSQRALIEQARTKALEIVREQVPSKVAAEVVIKHGTPYKEIIDAAAEFGADLIVMAAYRPSLKDYLLGPTTARVVRHADCSVLVVRNSTEEAG
jgi:universal stress protein F